MSNICRTSTINSKSIVFVFVLYVYCRLLKDNVQVILTGKGYSK